MVRPGVGRSGGAGVEAVDRFGVWRAHEHAADAARAGGRRRQGCASAAGVSGGRGVAARKGLGSGLVAEVHANDLAGDTAGGACTAGDQRGGHTPAAGVGFDGDALNRSRRVAADRDVARAFTARSSRPRQVGIAAPARVCVCAAYKLAALARQHVARAPSIARFSRTSCEASTSPAGVAIRAFAHKATVEPAPEYTACAAGVPRRIGERSASTAEVRPRVAADRVVGARAYDASARRVAAGLAHRRIQCVTSSACVAGALGAHDRLPVGGAYKRAAVAAGAARILGEGAAPAARVRGRRASQTRLAAEVAFPHAAASARAPGVRSKGGARPAGVDAGVIAGEGFRTVAPQRPAGPARVDARLPAIALWCLQKAASSAGIRRRVFATKRVGIPRNTDEGSAASACVPEVGARRFTPPTGREGVGVAALRRALPSADPRSAVAARGPGCATRDERAATAAAVSAGAAGADGASFRPADDASAALARDAERAIKVVASPARIGFAFALATKRVRSVTHPRPAGPARGPERARERGGSAACVDSCACAAREPVLTVAAKGASDASAPVVAGVACPPVERSASAASVRRGFVACQYARSAAPAAACAAGRSFATRVARRRIGVAVALTIRGDIPALYVLPRRVEEGHVGASDVIPVSASWGGIAARHEHGDDRPGKEGTRATRTFALDHAGLGGGVALCHGRRASGERPEWRGGSASHPAPCAGVCLVATGVLCLSGSPA